MTANCNKTGFRFVTGVFRVVDRSAVFGHHLSVYLIHSKFTTRTHNTHTHIGIIRQKWPKFFIKLQKTVLFAVKTRKKNYSLSLHHIGLICSNGEQRVWPDKRTEKKCGAASKNVQQVVNRSDRGIDLTTTEKCLFPNLSRTKRDNQAEQLGCGYTWIWRLISTLLIDSVGHQRIGKRIGEKLRAKHTHKQAKFIYHFVLL